MAPISNARVVFKRIPETFIVPGATTKYDATETIDLEHVPLHDGFLLKSLILSSDPYLRGRMRDPGTESYAPAFALGESINNFGIGVVLRSEDPKYQAGDHLYGILSFQEYAVYNANKALLPFMKLENPGALPWSLYVGILGMPGQTAFIGWKLYAEQKAQKARTLFVSAGAGQVGSLVIQLAKRTNPSLKVIASAGSNDKVKFIKSIGADIAFNYREESVERILSAHGPIDIYWDNVTGPTLDDTLINMSRGGLIVACGAISGYNGGNPGIKNFAEIFARSLTVHGFVLLDVLGDHLGEFYAEVPAMVAEGKFKYIEHRYHGLEQAEQALLDVHHGKNLGKAVIVL